MRKIRKKPIVQFTALLCLEAFLSILATCLVFGNGALLAGSLVALCFGLFCFGLLAVGFFRLILHFAPLPTGFIEEGSRDENRLNLYLLHMLILFNPWVFCRSLPVPLMRLLLQALGTHMGHNSYSAGVIMDPPLVHIGDDSIIGFDAIIAAHTLQGRYFSLDPIKIGNRVTIGGRAVIMSGCEIGDDVTIAIHSVVSRGTRIPAGETWGGTPARRLKPASEPDAAVS